MNRFILRYSYSLIRNLRGGNLGSRLRCFILKHLGCRIGNDCYIGPNVTIISPSNLTIGNNVSIHQDCYIDAIGGIQIGDDVSIAHSVSILSFNHNYSAKDCPIKKQGTTKQKIIIEDDVWVGCKVTILPGTIIRNRTVVGAMSLCNKIYNPNMMIAGIPAKPIKEI